MAKMKNLVCGMFDDEDTLLSAIKKIRDKNVKIDNVYSPYPVHGLDDALGLKRSRLPIFSFCVGATGFMLATFFQVYIHTYVWPLNIGGKPHGLAGLPSFVPIMFEVTVLTSALSIVAGFFFRSKLIPSTTTDVIDPRTTNDLHLLAIDIAGAPMDNQGLKNLLNENGAIEVNEKEVKE
jgi:hypothetical protein